MGETDRRRAKQLQWNIDNQITPTSIHKNINDILGSVYAMDYGDIPEVAEPEAETLSGEALQQHIRQLERKMAQAAADLRFEEAAKLRDELVQLRGT